jgi:hypothetical protein
VQYDRRTGGDGAHGLFSTVEKRPRDVKKKSADSKRFVIYGRSGRSDLP